MKIAALATCYVHQLKMAAGRIKRAGDPSTDISQLVYVVQLRYVRCRMTLTFDVLSDGCRHPLLSQDRHQISKHLDLQDSCPLLYTDCHHGAM